MSAADGRSTIDVACASDRNFEVAAAVLISSLLKSSADAARIHVHVIDGGLSPRFKAFARAMAGRWGARITLLTPQHGALAGARLSRQFPVAAWYRMLLPELLPPTLSRVIYLDTDILVNTPIEPLWRHELGANFLAARVSSLKTISNSRIVESEELRHLPDEPYFNSGVLLMNLDIMRREGVIPRAMDFARRYPHLTTWVDQDALNAVSVGRWSPLEARWNYLVREDAGEAFTLQPDSILHFLGMRKPWLREGYRGHEGTDIGAAHRLYASYLRQVAPHFPSAASGSDDAGRRT